jgi:phosphatidate cytidylyltransferase
MIQNNLTKRIITSVFLLTLLLFMFFYSFIMIIAVIFISVITGIEFYNLITKIFYKNFFLQLLFKSLSLIYLLSFSFIFFIAKSDFPQFEVFIYYSIIISISSDVGGLVIGKTLKGKKLTKISPNKTISGSLGSFLFSLLMIPFFIEYLSFLNSAQLVIITLLISLASQLGDLFISYLKRKAKVKDTGNLLPGHGGFLDRIDGILLSVPIGLILFIVF